MTLNDVTELVNIGNQINYYPVTVFVLDCVKLAMFTIYFGIDNIFQVYQLLTSKQAITGSIQLLASIAGKFFVNVANIANFVFMMQLSYSYKNVNDLLRTEKFLNSYEMANLFTQA